MDHDRVNVGTTRMSCGVMELSRVSDDTEGVLYALGSRLYHPSRGEPCAFFVLSDIADEQTNSGLLLDAVVVKGLGKVQHSTTEENPKTGNLICIGIWAIDHAAFKAWYSDARVKKIKKVGT